MHKNENSERKGVSDDVPGTGTAVDDKTEKKGVKKPMVEEAKSSAEFGAQAPENQVPIKGDDDAELTAEDDTPSAETKSIVVMSPAEIRDGIAVVKFFKDSQVMKDDEYSVNMHRLLKFWRRLMKLRK